MHDLYIWILWEVGSNKYHPLNYNCGGSLQPLSNLWFKWSLCCCTNFNPKIFKVKQWKISKLCERPAGWAGSASTAGRRLAGSFRVCLSASSRLQQGILGSYYSSGLLLCTIQDINFIKDISDMMLTSRTSYSSETCKIENRRIKSIFIF